MQHRQSSGAAWTTVGAAIAGAALVAILASLLRPDVTVALGPPLFLSGPVPLRCPSCGWIEAKREVAPKVYEYRLRLGDGSVSLFQETLPTTWRVGERLLVIEGRVALD